MAARARTQRHTTTDHRGRQVKDYAHWKTSSLRIALAQAKRNADTVGPEHAEPYKAQIERLEAAIASRKGR